MRIVFSTLVKNIIFSQFLVGAEWADFCRYFLGKRSETYSHKDTSKLFRFFPVRDIPLRFISSNVSFSAPMGRIYPIFVLTLRRVHDLCYSKFSAAENFSIFGELLAIKIWIFRCFGGQRVYFWVLCEQEAYKC